MTLQGGGEREREKEREFSFMSLLVISISVPVSPLDMKLTKESLPLCGYCWDLPITWLRGGKEGRGREGRA